MKHSTRPISLGIATLFALPALLRAAPSASLVLPVALSHPQPCESTAESTRKAARELALANYWLHIAACRNGAQCDLSTCLQDAWDERQAALERVEAQDDARDEVCELLGGGRYLPELQPTEFSPNVTNPYMPLVPGRTLLYEKHNADGVENVEFTALDRVVNVDGFPCRAVHFVERINGELTEDTIDWIAQRNDGTVWYFGEVVQKFEDGFLDNLEGSWRTGRNGALPGVLMRAAPAPGQVYRQEFLPNVAEDLAQVLAVNATVSVPLGTFQHCVQTEDWTPLSPGALERKYYAPGIGLVLELDPSNGDRLELVAIVE